MSLDHNWYDHNWMYNPFKYTIVKTNYAPFTFGTEHENNKRNTNTHKSLVIRQMRSEFAAKASITLRCSAGIRTTRSVRRRTQVNGSTSNGLLVDIRRCLALYIISENLYSSCGFQQLYAQHIRKLSCYAGIIEGTSGSFVQWDKQKTV